MTRIALRSRTLSDYVALCFTEPFLTGKQVNLNEQQMCYLYEYPYQDLESPESIVVFPNAAFFSNISNRMPPFKKLIDPIIEK